MLGTGRLKMLKDDRFPLIGFSADLQTSTKYEVRVMYIEVHDYMIPPVSWPVGLGRSYIQLCILYTKILRRAASYVLRNYFFRGLGTTERLS